MKRILYLVCLAIAACTGSGSEIGPVAPVITQPFFAGNVLAADGSPVVGALVQFEDTGNANATDSQGRFHLSNASNGSHVLSIDGRTGAARGVGEAFPKLRLPATVAGGTPLSIPVVLPNLADATGQAEQKTVAIGSTLGAGDDISVAGAGLTLTLNGARLDWVNPSEHVGEVQATVSVAIIPSHQSPYPLENTGAGLSPALVFWIDPPDLTFTTPATLSYTSAFFPDAASDVSLYRYDVDGVTWLPTGAASVAGGTITASAIVSHAGALSLAAPCAGATTISGRAIDGDGKAVAGALVTAPGGRSGITATNGTFSLADVCAQDGNATPISGTITITASAQQMPIQVSVTPALVPGGTTDVGDLVLRTQTAGEIHFLLIEGGAAVPHREVSVGAHELGFGARHKTDANGVVDFYNVPFKPGTPFQAISAKADTTKNPITVDSGGLFFDPAQFHSANLYSGPTGNFHADAFGGSIQVTVLREDSDAPIENAFVMIGTDPTTAQKGWTNSAGQLVLNAPSAPIVTAGVQTTAPAGGGGFDLVRMTAFCSVKAINANVIVLRLPVARRLDGLTQPWDAFGRISGSASQLTDPTVTAPVNVSGTYAVDLHASPASDARQLFAAMNERSDYDALIPAGTDPNAGYTSGGALDASYTIDAPAPNALLVGIERDATSASSGTITRFGVAGPITVAPGEALNGSLAFDQAVGGGGISLDVPGLEMALAPPQARFAIEAFNGLGALLGNADAQVNGFSAASGAGTFLVPVLSGALGGADYRVRLFGESNAGGILRRQDVFLRTAATSVSGLFLAVPEFTTPTPLGSFDPTGAGVVWTSSAETQLHRIRVTRSDSVTESGLQIRDDFDWRVYTQNADQSFVFPVLPVDPVVGKTVPVFFGSGQTHTIEIRALRALYFSFASYFVNTARVRLSELEPQSESIYQSSATTP